MAAMQAERGQVRAVTKREPAERANSRPIHAFQFIFVVLAAVTFVAYTLVFFDYSLRGESWCAAEMHAEHLMQAAYSLSQKCNRVSRLGNKYFDCGAKNLRVLNRMNSQRNPSRLGGDKGKRVSLVCF